MPNEIQTELEFDQVQLKRGLLKDWAEINPTLLRGEVGLIFDSETGKSYGYTFGDGTTAFNDLPIFTNGTVSEERIKQLENSVSVLQTTIATIQKLIPDTASETNKLATLTDIFTPSEDQLTVLNSGLTAEKVAELLALEDKIPTKTSELTNDGDGTSKFATIQDVESHAKAFTYVDETKTNVSTGLSIKGDVILEQEGDTSQSAASHKTVDDISSQKANAVNQALTTHINNSENPHNVTKAQVGLDSVDNTADADKPISTAAQEALDQKQNNLSGVLEASKYVMTPPSVDGGAPGKREASDFALATNLTTETSDRLAADANLDTKKVDKKEGYSLTQNDLTNELKDQYDQAVQKVKDISAGAQVNTIEKIYLNGAYVPPGEDKSVYLTNLATKTELSNTAETLKAADNTLDGKIATNATAIETERTARSTADVSLQQAINQINTKIPTEASTTNQLADKAFVNSSIDTNTATFQGTYASLDDLKAAAVEAKKNDYAYVRWTEEKEGQQVVLFKKYKYSGTGAYDPDKWDYEYDLNNSSFTAEQWAAINSGVTTGVVVQVAKNTQDISILKTDVQNHKAEADQKFGGITEQFNQVDISLSQLQSEVETNSTDIIALQNNKRDTEQVSIDNFFKNDAFILDGQKVYVSELEGQLIKDTEGNDSFYFTYLQELRKLPFGSIIPYKRYSDEAGKTLAIQSGLLAYNTDEINTTYIFSEEEALATWINIDDATQKIVFKIKRFQDLTTNTELTEVLKNYLKFKSDVTESSLPFLVYNEQEGVFQPSEFTKSSLPNEDSWMAKRYVKPSADGLNTSELYDQPLSEGKTELTSRQLTSGTVYQRVIDDISTNNWVTFTVPDIDSTVISVDVDSNLCCQLLSLSSSATPTLTLMNSSLSITATPYSVYDGLDPKYLAVRSLNLARSIVSILEKGYSARLEDVYTFNSIKDSKLSINNNIAAQSQAPTSYTFTSISNSTLDLNQTSTYENPLYILSKSTASRVYLHGFAKIKTTNISDETLEQHSQELEVILCSDYMLSADEAVNGTWVPSRITDLRVEVHDTGNYAVIVSATSDKIITVNGLTLPNLMWSTATQGFTASIPYETHHCGYIGMNGFSTIKIPKVKTYSLVNNSTFEEVYDSAAVDIKTGQVTVYSNSTTPIYLVVIS